MQLAFDDRNWSQFDGFFAYACHVACLDHVCHIFVRIWRLLFELFSFAINNSTLGRKTMNK